MAKAQADYNAASQQYALWGNDGAGRIGSHAAVAAIGAALGGGNVAGAVGGTVAGDIAGDAAAHAGGGALAGNIASGAAGALAGGALGGAGGAMSGANGALGADLYNRQLHPEEKTKAQQIADEAKALGLTNADGSPITLAQIQNAMRAANNSQYGEFASTGAVVPLNADTPKGAVYDTTGMTLVTDSTGNYLVQDPSMLGTPSRALQDLITQNTGGASSPYSWGTSTSQAAAPTIDPYGPFSPTFNTGDYSAGFGTPGRGLAGDYVSGSVSILSGAGGVATNLYDGTTYLSGGVFQSFPGASWDPGLTATVGWIYGANDAKSVNNFMNGEGNQVYISIPTPFGVNLVAAITHAYGGSTALELGAGSPGGLNVGVTPWSHGVPVIQSNK